MVVTYSKHGTTVVGGSGMFPIVELNISTIVLSGLGLLIVFKAGIEGPSTRVTPVTYIAAMICIVLLVCGSLLYAVTSVDMNLDNVNVTLLCLFLAVLMSLLLTIEQAWLAVLFQKGG